MATSLSNRDAQYTWPRTLGVLLAGALALSACHHHKKDSSSTPPAPSTRETLVGAGMRGGPEEAGALFTVDPASRALSLASTFSGTPYHSYQATTTGGFVYNPGDGRMYALANEGGSAGCGAIVSFPPDHPEQMTTLYSFTSLVDGKNPMGNPAVVGGALYGVTALGGAHDEGTIWKFTLASRTLQVLAQLGTVDAAGSPPTYNASGLTTGLFADGGGGLYGTFEDGHQWIRIRPAQGDALDLPAGPHVTSFAVGSGQDCFGLEPLSGPDVDLHRMALQPDQDPTISYSDLFQDFNAFGTPPHSLVYSYSGNQFLFLTGSTPLTAGVKGRMVRFNHNGNYTGVCDFQAGSLQYPQGMQALPMSQLLGYSQGIDRQALWWSDTITYNANQVLQLVPNEYFGDRIGAGPRQGYIWASPIVSHASMPPFTLNTYSIDTNSVTRTTLGYSDGSSPVGAPVRLADGGLYGLCHANNFDSEGLFDGYPGGDRLYRWDPQTGLRTALGSVLNSVRLMHPPTVSPDSADTNLYTVGFYEHGNTVEWRLITTATPAGTRTMVTLGETVADSAVSWRARGAAVIADPVAGGNPLTVYACSQTKVVAVVGGSATTIGVLPAGSVTVGAPVINGTTLFACYADASNGGIARFDLAGTLPVTPTLTALPAGAYFDSTPFVAADGSIVAAVAYEAIGGGALYSINPTSGALSSVITINGAAATACPRGTLCQTADGTIWGMATTTSGNGLLANDSATGSYVWGYKTNGTVVYQALSRSYGFGDTFPGLINTPVDQGTLSVPAPAGSG